MCLYINDEPGTVLHVRYVLDETKPKNSFNGVEHRNFFKYFHLAGSFFFLIDCIVDSPPG